MTKDEALQNIRDAVRATQAATNAGEKNLEPYRKAWRDAVSAAKANGASKQEIRNAEKEGLAQ